MAISIAHLFDLVQTRFALDAAALDPPAPPVPMAFGWKAPTAQDPKRPRYTWVPGDDANGALGDLGPARFPGRLPARPIATLRELVTIYVEGADVTAPEDERVQYESTRALYDALVRAVHLAIGPNFAIRSQGWVTGKTVRRHGATLRVVLSVEAVIADAPLELAPVDTTAAVTPQLEQGDETEDDAHVPDTVEPAA